MTPANRFDPVESLARVRHEFGEHGGVNMSIEASTTFTVMKADLMPNIFGGKLGPDRGPDSAGSHGEGQGCYLYGRHFNPTVYVLGRYLAAMEGTEAGYCTSSGLGAIAATMMQLCQPGDEIVAAATIYGGTFALFNDYFPVRTGVTTRWVDINNLDAVEQAITPKTRAIYCETMANPTLNVTDIPAIARIARAHKLPVVVDNTFAPMIVSPAQLGADIVIHSVTKFISGASDIIAGAVCASKDFIASMMDVHHGSLMLLGPTMDPRVAFDLSLRLPHLAVRMQEHSRRAQFLAERLHQRGLPVTYPGLPSHHQHAMIKRLINPGFGFGGVLGLDLGSVDRAYRFMELLQNELSFGYLAVSLGYFDTLMSCSGSSTSSEMSEEAKASAGIPPGYVRMSIGLTGDVELRWKQLAYALDAVHATARV